MPITLSQDQEAFVADLVDDAFYEDVEAVITAAFAALKVKLGKARRLAELRREIDKGEADIAAGRISTRTAFDILDEIRRRKAVNPLGV